MNPNFRLRACCGIGLFLLAVSVPLFAQVVAMDPATMPKTGSVSDRYQSFNIEMIEVTGGRFWAPYKHGAEATPATGAGQLSTPGGMPASLYQYRKPIDLANPRLRKLAAALGPSYMRVSGTWANTTYFQDSDHAAPAKPPAGFSGVLTREEWKGVVDFSRAADAKIVTSFAISPGMRNANGVWTPVEAKKLLSYTKSIGGSIAAAEMFNEPTFAAMGGAPKGYDVAAYGRDFRAFDAFMRKAAPGTLVLGPGSIGDAGLLGSAPGMHMLRSEDLLAAAGPGLDGFSYHFYGAVSQRCKMLGSSAQTTPAAALTMDWLFRADGVEAFYAKLRDRFAPGKPIWLTETADAACGGNPWAADFIDSFRYLNQLGTLATRGVQVVMHNTLAGSDYGLIDESTMQPRPDYWAALLWRRLMGTTVLSAGAPSSPDLYVYAHCLRGHPGGVALLAINADRTASREISLPLVSRRYTLSSSDLMDKKVELNGQEMSVSADGDLPRIRGIKTRSGRITLAPATITFLGVAKAGNASCR